MLVVNPATTTMLTGALVRIIPLSSVATAVRVFVPAATLAQAKPKGADVSSPTFAALLKNPTLKTVPSRSVALAVRLIVEVATKTLLEAGLVRLMVGGMLEETGGYSCVPGTISRGTLGEAQYS